ncbi:MAG TPA: tetratricopeptide repeat protein [Thermoanaerobaculia bacterium]|jgi:tetratricopeptide (TPR) repeat protein|nr:tetratricopeptide repeat protein [Thermoanaerobaculia bacterium]
MEPQRPSRRHVLALGAILTLALALRLGHWWAVRHQPFFAWLAMDSQEYDRWAREIAGGDWLGSQVFFQAPLYPYFLAILYAVFGHSLDAVYLFQIALAVAGCWALYRAGREMAGETTGEEVGLGAALLAALYGPFLFYDAQLLKESPAVAVTSFLLWALAAARARQGLRRWLGAGALLGILALLRENALLLVPFLLPLAWSREGKGPAFVRRGGALVAGLVLVLLPIAVRNGLVGGSFLPTTSQGGVNFYIGNNPQADGTYQPIVPGKQVPALERREPARLAEQAMGRRLSAGEVSRYWLDRSFDWIRREPGAFVRLQVRKLGMFWSWYEWPDAVDYYHVKTLSPVLRLPLLEFGGAVLLALAGLALARRRLGPFAPVLLFTLGWMLTTVVFFLFSRYRLPAVPALLVLGGVTISGAAEAWRDGNRRRTYGLAAIAVTALLLPRALGYEPRMDLVEYNLGRLYDEQGRREEAREHYKAAFVLNPKDFLACLNLGNLAARGGDWPTALRFYQRAAALEPRSDDAESNQGGVYLAMGDLAQAEAHLGRALALNPQNLPALQNQTLLRARRGDLAGARELNRRLLELDPANPAGLRLRGRLGG